MRTLTRNLAVRHASAGAARVGGIAVPFNQWARVNDGLGDFMERFLPGSFTRTLREDRPAKLLFQHGKDPSVGQKVLGAFELLHETHQGLEFEGAMLDTSYSADIAEGIRAGQYGMSISFRVHRERLDRNARPSLHNPDGLPERSVVDAELFEISVVTWPAYSGTAVALRGFRPSWALPLRIPYEPLRVAVRSQPWRLGPKPWRLAVRKR